MGAPAAPVGALRAEFLLGRLLSHAELSTLQVVAHLVDGYMDGDPVPVPHFGVALSVNDFQRLAERLKGQVDFAIEPHLRFGGQPGEQWTMFFYDPSGNALEFKAMTNPDNLFAKYRVE
ncbi:hypothetical protein ABPG77_000254 [Micractinium sp. CCAP 211/92]